MRISRDITMQAMKAIIYSYVCSSTVCAKRVASLLSSCFILLNQWFLNFWYTFGRGLFFFFCRIRNKIENELCNNGYGFYKQCNFFSHRHLISDHLARYVRLLSTAFPNFTKLHPGLLYKD
jgi:hypothetical protein